MSSTSNIEWTDATWNPVRGCTKVSPGCAHCYAETFAERWRGVPNHPYTQGFDLRLVPEKLDEPLKWKSPKRIFVNSMSDLFQDGVSEIFIMNVFLTMEKCPHHIFQVLTKRAERMRDVVQWLGRKWADAGDRWPLPNVWLGVSVENQHFADERIPLLLQTPATVRFISAEPLLGDVNLLRYMRAPGPPNAPASARHYLDWVIVGGESGQGARPFELDWARSIVRQCQQAKVAVFVKQLGANVLLPSLGKTINLDGKKNADITRFPEELRVREFPTARTA